MASLDTAVPQRGGAQHSHAGLGQHRQHWVTPQQPLLRVLEVLAGDTVVLWTRRGPLPHDVGVGRRWTEQAALRDACVTVRLHDVRAPAPRAPHGYAALEFARRLMPRGTRVWLQQLHGGAGLPQRGNAAPGARIECRCLRIERAPLGAGGDHHHHHHHHRWHDASRNDRDPVAVPVVVLDEALLRTGLGYYHAGARYGAGAPRDMLMALEEAARRARLNVWAPPPGAAAAAAAVGLPSVAGALGGERPWDAERRERAQGRRSPSPRRYGAEQR